MKKVLFMLAFMLISTVSFANNNLEKKITINKKSELIKKVTDYTSHIDNLTITEEAGRCRVRIIDNRTGETVYDVTWPLGTEAECHKLTKMILDDFNRK